MSNSLAGSISISIGEGGGEVEKTSPEKKARKKKSR
jgi:hypothetical protein